MLARQGRRRSCHRDHPQGNRSFEWAASRGGRRRSCPPGGRVPPRAYAPREAYPTSNQTSGVAWSRILRCTRCRKTRTRARSRSSTSAMREAACSALARRPSPISPKVSRWSRRPPDHATTVSTRLGAPPVTIAPLQYPRPKRRKETKAGRSAMTTATCTGGNARSPPLPFPFRSRSSMTRHEPSRAQVGPTTARHPRASTLTPISADPAQARSTPRSWSAWRRSDVWAMSVAAVPGGNPGDAR